MCPMHLTCNLCHFWLRPLTWRRKAIDVCYNKMLDPTLWDNKILNFKIKRWESLELHHFNVVLIGNCKSNSNRNLFSNNVSLKCGYQFLVSSSFVLKSFKMSTSLYLCNWRSPFQIGHHLIQQLIKFESS